MDNPPKSNLKYWICFALQSLGALVMLWEAVPMYRDFINEGPGQLNSHSLWAIVVNLLIQPAFWLGRPLRPVIENLGPWRPILGIVIMFTGRITLIFIGSVVTAVFYNRMATDHFTASRVCLLLSILFSMFCYTTELERLGARFYADK